MPSDIGLCLYHATELNCIENVTIEYIEGNCMREVPLRCPYFYN